MINGHDPSLRRPVSDTTLLQYLSAHRLFGILPSAVLVDLATQVVGRTYAKGHHLYYAGDALIHVILMQSGLVAATKLDERGNVHTMLTFHPGDILGLASVVCNLPWTWTAIALTETQVLLLRIDTFLDLYRRFPELAYQVAHELAALLLRAQETQARLTLSPVASRVAAFLLECAGTATGPRPDCLSLDLSLSYQELAFVLGTTRETVSRVLTRLAHSGLITISGRQVLILRSDVLRRLAEQ